MKAPSTLIHALRFIKRTITHGKLADGVTLLKPYDEAFAVGQRVHQNYPFDVVGLIRGESDYSTVGGMLRPDCLVEDTETKQTYVTSEWWANPIIMLIDGKEEECTWYPVTPIYKDGKIVQMRVQGKVYDVDDLEPYIT